MIVEHGVGRQAALEKPGVIVLYLAVSNFAQMQIQWFKVRTYFIGEFLI